MSISENLNESLKAQLEALDDDDDKSQTILDRWQVPIQEELKIASKINHEARLLVGKLMEDARMGRQVKMDAMPGMIKRMSHSMLRNRDALLSLSILKKKDDYTFLHSVNVGVFVIAFCQSLGLDEESVIGVGLGAMLHDIGKVQISDAILNKPGRLSKEEYNIIKNHVGYSHDFLVKCPEINDEGLQVALEHHERYDGTGYPNGLKGEEISLFGQMATIVDVYDAITCRRSYHSAMSAHLALKKMLSWSGDHFNNQLFQSFVQCIGIYPVGSLVRLENGLVCIVTQNHPTDMLFPQVEIIGDANSGRKLDAQLLDLSEKKHEGTNFWVAGLEFPARWLK